MVITEEKSQHISYIYWKKQLDFDAIQFGHNQNAFYLINRQISSYVVEHHYYTWFPTLQIRWRWTWTHDPKITYLFSFGWKITVIYCFVVCPFNEWFFFFFRPKVRRRFVENVSFCWFGLVWLLFSFLLRYCMFCWTSSKMWLQ